MIDFADILNQNSDNDEEADLPINLRIVMDFIGGIEHKYSDIYGYPKRGEAVY